MPATAHRREGRISLRVTTEQRDLLTRAAVLASAELSRFVADAALQAAKVTIEMHGFSHVTEASRKRFYDLLFNPPEPSEALIALMASGPTAWFRNQKVE